MLHIDTQICIIAMPNSKMWDSPYMCVLRASILRFWIIQTLPAKFITVTCMAHTERDSACVFHPFWFVYFLSFALFIIKQVRHTCCWLLCFYVHCLSCYCFVCIVPRWLSSTSRYSPQTDWHTLTHVLQVPNNESAEIHHQCTASWTRPSTLADVGYWMWNQSTVINKDICIITYDLCQ